MLLIITVHNVLVQSTVAFIGSEMEGTYGTLSLPVLHTNVF